MEISLFLQQDAADQRREASARSKKVSVGQHSVLSAGQHSVGQPNQIASQFKSGVTQNDLAIRKMRKRRGRRRGRSNVFIPPPPPPPKVEDGVVVDGVEGKRAEDEYEQGMHGDKNEMLSMMWLVRGWMLDCGAHGVSKIISNANFKRRGFWLVAVMCSACMLLYQLGTMLADIQTYPVTVNLQVVARPALPFPVVTICNSNKLKKSALWQLPENHHLRKGIGFEEYSLVGLSDIKDALTEQFASFDNDTSDVANTTASPDNVTDTTLCTMDRDYVGEVYAYLDYTDDCEYSWWGTTCRKEYAFDYSPVVSPGNQFQCGSGECVSQIDLCDTVVDCWDGSDEAVEQCSGCLVNQYQCRDGTCISAKLRCNSVFDCPDGSDELREHCDVEVMDPEAFVCCNSDLVIPRAHTCDGVDDCFGDKSDTYLLGCVNGSLADLSGANVTLPCPKFGTEYGEGLTVYVRPDQIGDGIVDCLFEMDEICAWKTTLDGWLSPTETDAFAEYETFLGYVQTQPAKTRWYTMADEGMISSLGHQLDDLVMQCVYNNKACSRDMTDPIESVHQDYGKCYSYVAHQQMTSPGIKYGFTVVFNLEAYDTIGFFAPSSSLKMFFTHPEKFGVGDGAYIDTASLVSLTPGQEHAIEIHPVKQTKLPDPYSLCEIYGEGRLAHFKSKQQCESDCRNRRNSKVCGCVDDVNFRDGSLCALSDKKARICVDKMNTGFDTAEHCDCPTSCESLGYGKTITSSLYPTSIPNFFSSLFASFQSKSTTEFTLEVLEKYNQDVLEESHNGIQLLRNSFGKVTVYFKDLTETTIEERPVYDFITILSTCGGLLGLYMGFSLLTVLEVVDFFFDLYEVGTIRGMKRRFDRQQAREAALSPEEEFESSGESEDEEVAAGARGLENKAFDADETSGHEAGPKQRRLSSQAP